MKYSLSALKREINDGQISIELLPEGRWEAGVPDHLQGVRQCVYAGAKHITIRLLKPGKVSRCDIPRASLVDYDGDTLKTYLPGLRAPTAAEQKVLDEWKAITETDAFKKRVDLDLRTDGWTAHNYKVKFFHEKKMDYLNGFDEHGGLKLLLEKQAVGETAFIRDKSIKGDLMLSYKVYHK